MARKFVGGLPLGAIIALCAILLVAPDAHSQVTRKKYVITGTVGLAGVTMQGFPTPTMTDDNGVYTVEVFYGWTGTVSPVKAGYTFEPRAKNYPKVTTSLNDENYVANIVTSKISGSAALPGVTMNGFVEEVITV